MKKNRPGADREPDLRLTLREAGRPTTRVAVGPAEFGGARIVFAAGPCSVEPESVMQIARAVRNSGASMLRGGAFKPRTSPYAFQGMGEAGLGLLAEAGAATGLPVVTEVLDPRDVPLVSGYADMLQIGSRSIQNFPLLREAGASGKPVLLKRGMMTTVHEWLCAAEYVLAEGNDQVVLCERGIRTFESTTRNTLDLNSVVRLRELTHLPVIVDPSHGTGRASLVAAMSRAAVAAGADGLLIEVHTDPEHAYSDGFQSIDPPAFDALVAECSAIYDIISHGA